MSDDEAPDQELPDEEISYLEMICEAYSDAQFSIEAVFKILRAQKDNFACKDAIALVQKHNALMVNIMGQIEAFFEEMSGRRDPCLTLQLPPEQVALFRDYFVKSE